MSAPMCARVSVCLRMFCELSAQVLSYLIIGRYVYPCTTVVSALTVSRIVGSSVLLYIWLRVMACVLTDIPFSNKSQTSML